MQVTFKLNKPDDSDLSGFIRILTDNHYKVTFERNNTKCLMARVELTPSQIRETESVVKNSLRPVCCRNCNYVDSIFYTVFPPMVKCKITDQLHYESDSCNVDDRNIKIYSDSK